MNRLLAILICLFLLVQSTGLQAVPGAGITPCTTTPATMTVTSTSSNFQLSACGDTLIVFNNSAVDAYFALGSASTKVATTADNLVPARTFVVVNVSTARFYFAAITGSSTATLSFIQGLAAS